MSVSTLHLLSTEGKPLVRFELTTHALRMRCSTPELQRQMLCAAAAYHTIHTNASLFLEKFVFLPFSANFRPIGSAELILFCILGLNLVKWGYKICAL